MKDKLKTTKNLIKHTKEEKMESLQKVAIFLTALGMSVVTAILGIIYGYYFI